jgi:hypothetical protein
MVGVFAWSLATAVVPVGAGFMPGLVLSRILVNSTHRKLDQLYSILVFIRI